MQPLVGVDRSALGVVDAGIDAESGRFARLGDLDRPLAPVAAVIAEMEAARRLSLGSRSLEDLIASV